MGLTSEQLAERRNSKRLDQIEITTGGPENTGEPYIFISYKSDDWEVALEEVVYTLQKKYGVRVYYDRAFEDKNEFWIDSMESNLLSPFCLCVLAFFSKNYITSYATLLELLTSQRKSAADQMMGGGTKEIIPVYLENARDIEADYKEKLREEFMSSGRRLSDSTGIKKIEWEAYENCIRDCLAGKKTPDAVKQVCKELERIKDGQDVKIGHVVTAFEDMEEAICRNKRQYPAAFSYDALAKTIKEIEKKVYQGKYSVFAQSLINKADSEPLESGKADSDKVKSGKAKSDNGDAAAVKMVKKPGAFSREEYWEEFLKYAFEKSGNQEFLKESFSRSKVADRNWHALFFGSGKGHVELSVSTQKKTARTALLLDDRTLLEPLEKLLQENNLTEVITVDSVSKTVILSMKIEVDLTEDWTKHFDWFMSCACTLKKLFDAARG